MSCFLHLVQKYICTLDRYCTDRYRGEQRVTKTALKKMCEEDLKCKAIDYHHHGEYGHLCSSTKDTYPDFDGETSNWEVCNITRGKSSAA